MKFSGQINDFLNTCEHRVGYMILETIANYNRRCTYNFNNTHLKHASNYTYYKLYRNDWHQPAL